MKKLIGTVSFAMVMGCALALANANDDANSNTNNGTSDMNNQPGMVHQEPGTAADSNTVDSNAAKSETTTTTTTNKTAMNKKSCTDANGKVILKGHTGYTACLKYKKAQMGGIADDSLNDTSSSSYNNK